MKPKRRRMTARQMFDREGALELKKRRRYVHLARKQHGKKAGRAIKSKTAQKLAQINALYTGHAIPKPILKNRKPKGTVEVKSRTVIYKGVITERENVTYTAPRQRNAIEEQTAPYAVSLWYSAIETNRRRH